MNAALDAFTDWLVGHRRLTALLLAAIILATFWVAR